MPYSWIRLCALLAFSLGIATVIGCQRGKAPPPTMPPAQVTVARPVLYPVQHYLDYNGFLDAVETVQLKARVKGFLQEIHFKEGEEVKEGDLLYRIDPREYTAEVAKSKADIAKANADIKNSEAQIELAKAELERVNRGVAGGVAAKTDQDKAVAQLAANRAQLDTANANVAAAEASLETAKLNLEYTTIKAPISGRISRTQVTKGNLVGQNELTLLTTIVRMDPLYVYFDVPERDLVEYQRSLKEKSPGAQREHLVEVAVATASGPAYLLWRNLAQSEPPVEVAVATEEGYPHVGKIDFRENRVETGTGTIRIRGRIPNPLINATDRLLYPGLYARVRIPVGEPERRPVIPEDALMTGQEGRYVYVIGEGNKVEKRTVTVGPQVWAPPPPDAPHQPGWTLINPHPADQDKGGQAAPKTAPVQSIVAIEKGLNAGERIIVNGLQKARPGEPVSPDEWQLQEPPASKPVEKK